MDSKDYKLLMQFFPPVDINIENPYVEANSSYSYYNAISPLKQTEKDLSYSIQIMNDLRLLRLLLNSNLTPDRFFYEINKMYDAWGPEGPYSRNILNTYFINIYNKIKLKELKLQELIKEGSSVALDYELGELEKQLSDVSLIKYKHNPKDFNRLDMTKLNISNKYGKSTKSTKSTKSIIKKNKNKK